MLGEVVFLMLLRFGIGGSRLVSGIHRKSDQAAESGELRRRVKATEQRPRKDRSLFLSATLEKSQQALRLPFLLAAAHLVDGGDEEAPMKNMHVAMPNTPN